MTKERKGKRLVKNFITNDIRNLNKGPYQEYPKKHFWSCSLAASFGGKHIRLKLYIHFKDICSSQKEGEERKKISKQIWERTSSFPPFNCKGDKKIRV